MADSRVSVLLDFQSRLQGIQGATQGLTNMVKTLAGAAAAYLSFRAVLRGGSDVIKFGADLQHTSQQTGVAVGSLAILQQAFEDNGVAAEKAGTSVAKMQRTIVDAAQQPTLERLIPFRQLNLDVNELLKLKPAEQFNAIGAAISAIQDPAVRSATAMQIFGKSGAELLPVFVGGIDDAAASLGQLPGIIERNAKSFERIDTLIGRMRNHSRQFFTGFFDETEQYIRQPLEALDDIDFTRIGQKLGAFAGIAIDAWREGKFPEFLALSIEAGIEAGTASAKGLFTSFVDQVSGPGFWSSLTNIIASFGVAVGKAFLTALVEPVALLRATFVFLKEESLRIVSDIQVAVFSAMAALPGETGKQFAFLAALAEQLKPASRDFGTIWDENRQKVSAANTQVSDFLTEQLRLTREIIGVESTGDKQRISAAERLGQLIQDRLDKREKEAALTAGVPASARAGAPPPVATAPNFAERIAKDYLTARGGEDGKGDRGDFGVGVKAAALAGLQDVWLQMGTAATRVFDAVKAIGTEMAGGISTSLQGLLKGTMTWGDAIRNIGVTFGQSIIKSFSDMVAQYAVSKATMFLIDKVYAARGLALTVANAAKSLVAWIPAAIAAAISSFGIAAVVGVAAALAALAAFGGFAEGGFTGAGHPGDIAGAVHRGEFVFSAPAVNAIGAENLAAVHNAARRGSYATGGLVGGSASNATSGGSSERPQIVIGLFGLRDEAERWARSREGQKTLVDIGGRNRRDMGIPT